MNKNTMTDQLARAAAKDAADRRMNIAGRKAWSSGDYNLAVRTFNRLFPVRPMIETSKIFCR